MPGGEPRGGQPYRVDDVLVACAAAQVPGQRFLDLGIAGCCDIAQQVVRRDDQARCAGPALDRAGLDDRLLHHIGCARVAQALHGAHLATLRLPGRDQAGAHRHVVEPDRAGPAFALLAGVLRARQAEPFPQQEQQRLALPHVVRDCGGTVDRARHAHRRPSSWYDRHSLAVLARTSSIGSAAWATRSPKRWTVEPGSVWRESHSPCSASSAVRNSSAASAGRAVGAADPRPVPAQPRRGSSAIANEDTAMTMALRTPTLANCSGPRALGTRIVAISSSGASTLRLTPVKNSRTLI